MISIIKLYLIFFFANLFKRDSLIRGFSLNEEEEISN